MENCGIYLITCTPPGKWPVFYVGQSNDLKRRLGQHRSNLRHGRHHNFVLQAHFRKYGADTFVYSVLEQCDLSDLDAVEGWWLSEMVGQPRVCNVGTTPGAANRGVKFSAEHRLRISKGHLGKKKPPVTDEARLNMSLAKRGWIPSMETRAKMSAHQVGPGNRQFGKTGAQNKNSKAVIGTCLKTNEVVCFESVTESEKGGFLKAKVSDCCNGKRRVHKGYSWAFAN